MKTLSQSFFETVARHGNRDALRYKQDGVWKGITYAEYGRRARALASGLVELKVAPGDRVVVLSENRPEWVIADQAILMTGAATVPIYPTLTGPQSQYIINNCGARVIIVSSEVHLRKLLAEQANMPDLRHVIVMNECPQALEGGQVLLYSDVLDLGTRCIEVHGAELDRRLGAATGDSLASIVYTSGTTGEPKGAMLTHGNLYSNLQEVAPVLALRAEDSGLSFLPLSHVLERIANYAIVSVGALVNFAESVEAVPQNLSEVKPTMMVSVPRLFEKIKARVLDKVSQDSPLAQQTFRWAFGVGKEYVDAKALGGPVNFALALKHSLADHLVFSKIRSRTGGNLRLCVSGGAPLPADVGQFFGIIGLPIVEGYGLTETSPVISLNRIDDIKYGTVGKPIPGVEVKLAEDGELLCRGPNVMPGYWNNPEATAEAIDAGGWFHTGDIAVFDEAGRIKIVDRKKEILVMSNGKKVAPQPIENALKASNLVEQVMLIGDRRNFISALIVPNVDALKPFLAEHRLEGLAPAEQLKHSQVQGLFAKEIAAACEPFARYEQVKKFALLPRAFDPDQDELTPTLKVKRRVIAAHFAADIEALYAAETVSA